VSPAVRAALQNAHHACRCRRLGSQTKRYHDIVWPCTPPGRYLGPGPLVSTVECAHTDCADPLHVALDDLARAIEAAA